MNIAVCGFYNHGNIGDEGFKPAIVKILGAEHTYVFTDSIPDDINDYDRLVIGGGSFLDDPIPGTHRVRIPFGFLGVGVHTVIHQDNMELLKNSNLRVARNITAFGDWMVGPDLLFAQMPEFAEIWDGEKEMEERHAAFLKDKEKHVLVVLNGFLMPHEKSEAYGLLALRHFREQLLRLERHYGSVRYIAMQTEGIDDRWVRPDIELGLADPEMFGKAMWASDLVLSTRFHGCVYATMLGIPFVAISPHDKFRSYVADMGWGNIVDYYDLDYRGVIGAANVCPSQEVLHRIAWKHYNWWKISTPYIRSCLQL